MTDHTSSSTNGGIVVTDTAVAEVKRLIEQEPRSDLFLRIGVSAGGCSGMSYVMAFDTQKTDNDQEFDHSGLRLVVDSRVLPYLSGATLDYKGGMLGGGFVFQNPNAKRSCGCGSSFTC